MKVADLFRGVWIGKPLKLRSLYSKRDLSSALTSPVSAQTVTVVASDTGKVIGYRTLYQK